MNFIIIKLICEFYGMQVYPVLTVKYLVHRKLKQIQQAQTIVTNTIVCTVCGGAGHIAQDCKERK